MESPVQTAKPNNLQVVAVVLATLLLSVTVIPLWLKQNSQNNEAIPVHLSFLHQQQQQEPPPSPSPHPSLPPAPKHPGKPPKPPRVMPTPRPALSMDHPFTLSNPDSIQGALACLRGTFESGPQDSSVYSQVGEDGILDSIFRCIGVRSKYYVEFGTESGTQCSTRFLREHRNFTGLLMDGSNENAAINLHREMIYAENIVQLFEKYKVPKPEFDLLTVDLDMNTFYVAREVLQAGYRPRVLVMEINRNLGPEMSYTVPYMPHEVWMVDGDGATGGGGMTCYFGATAAATTRLAEAYGYSLVAMDALGVNLYFVHMEATTAGQQVFTLPEVDENIPGMAKWASSQSSCYRSMWMEVPQDLDFKSQDWKSRLQPSMLSYRREEQMRVFYKVQSDLKIPGRR